ncbi:MAG: A24 family peptidase [Bdellovibrionota bacterium]
MSSSFATAAPLVAATAILVAGVVDDLRSRKFHNWLFGVCAALAIVVLVVAQGPGGMVLGVLGFTAGFALLTPFVLMKIIGAGDMKLMAAFGIVAGWEAVVTVSVAAVLWGALFGLARTVLRGQIKTLASNIVSIAIFRQRQGLELQTMPFTVAILMGWLTHLVIVGVM